MITLVEVLTRTETYFRDRGVSSPRLEAELLLCHVLGTERLQLYLMHDRPLSQPELEALRPLVRRRGGREPLAWILGHKEFHALDLVVEPGVLVPRPDTETLVEAALEWIGEEADPVYVADVGCGTGAVGLAVAKARPGVRLYATDIDDIALRVTKENVKRLELTSRVAVLKGDLLSPIPTHRPVDWVLSNPPYIATAAFDGLEPEVSRHEPRCALDGGADGLDIYRRLVPLAAERAREGVIVEVGHQQAGGVTDLFRRQSLSDVTTWNDLGGVPRVVGARRTHTG
ncbi:MAG: peptide chain release factor N(5)-glutamine methyltransferase [Deltaproteobacteria bacterium]|nr:peptide chain release factor N(5)-glutamine methyltransferase [Deltaproteobacteria bacterium]